MFALASAVQPFNSSCLLTCFPREMKNVFCLDFRFTLSTCESFALKVHCHDIHQYLLHMRVYCPNEYGHCLNEDRTSVAVCEVDRGALTLLSTAVSLRTDRSQLCLRWFPGLLFSLKKWQKIMSDLAIQHIRYKYRTHKYHTRRSHSMASNRRHLPWYEDGTGTFCR